MTLIQKIKTYFIRNEFCSWKNFHWDDYEFTFQILTEESLLDIGLYVKENLEPSKQIGNKRHRLLENKSVKCESLDELLPVLRDIIRNDYSETVVESVKYKWDFRYFVARHERCENTIRICNGLRTTEGSQGNCIYPLATIRKYNGNYYCWNHAH
ncbi:MAG TPA: hypothetical protein VF676_02875 [Flavobacterium sp.]|jgi:hypothetical protein